MPFHVSCSLSVGKGRQTAFPLTLRVGAKHGYIMDELGCIQQAPETKCFPHQRKTAGNLIDFINISKERMCQSERGFDGEGPRMMRRALAVRFPGVQRERVVRWPAEHLAFFLRPTLQTQAEVTRWLPLQYSCREESY